MRNLVLAGTAALGLAAIGSAQSTLYVSDSIGDTLYTVNPTTGVATFHASITGGISTPAALAYDPGTDTMYVADSGGNDDLWKLNYNTGVVTLIGAYNRPGLDPVMHGLEFNSTNGKLYGLDFRDKALVEINTSTGQATTIGITAMTGFGSLAWDATNGVMYMGDTGTDSLYTVNLATGASTLVGAYNEASSSSLGTGLAWDPTFGLMGIDNSGVDGLYSINTGTGQATLVGSMGTGNKLGAAFVPVPEPGTMAVLGLGALALMRRRKKKTA